MNEAKPLISGMGEMKETNWNTIFRADSVENNCFIWAKRVANYETDKKGESEDTQWEEDILRDRIV